MTRWMSFDTRELPHERESGYARKASLYVPIFVEPIKFVLDLGVGDVVYRAEKLLRGGRGCFKAIPLCVDIRFFGFTFGLLRWRR